MELYINNSTPALFIRNEVRILATILDLTEMVPIGILWELRRIFCKPTTRADVTLYSIQFFSSTRCPHLLRCSQPQQLARPHPSHLSFCPSLSSLTPSWSHHVECPTKELPFCPRTRSENHEANARKSNSMQTKGRSLESLKQTYNHIIII